MPKSKRNFEVEIEATVRVAAFDEESARKKVQNALSSGRSLAADVASAGKVFTYSATPVAEHD